MVQHLGRSAASTSQRRRRRSGKNDRPHPKEHLIVHMWHVNMEYFQARGISHCKRCCCAHLCVVLLLDYLNKGVSSPGYRVSAKLLRLLYVEFFAPLRQTGASLFLTSTIHIAQGHLSGELLKIIIANPAKRWPAAVGSGCEIQGVTRTFHLISWKAMCPGAMSK